MEFELQQIAEELQKIRLLLETLIPPPVLPVPPEKPWDKDRISYIDEDTLWAQEQEELRQIQRGLIPNLNEDLDDSESQER